MKWHLIVEVNYSFIWLRTNKYYDLIEYCWKSALRTFLRLEKKRVVLDHDLKMDLYVIIPIENHILAALEYLINDISQ